MKKILLILLSVLLITNLCGCSLILNSIVEQDSVSTLKSWQFQHDESTKDYSVFFAFFNKNDKAVASDATVEIRIVDEAGNELYKATRKITKNDSLGRSTRRICSATRTRGKALRMTRLIFCTRMP